MVETLQQGIPDDVPSNQEIGAEVHLLDDVELLLDPSVGFLVGGAVSVGHPVEGQLPKQLPVVMDVAGKTPTVLHFVVEVDAAGSQQGFGMSRQFRIEGVGRPHPFGRQQQLVGRGTGLGVETRQQDVTVHRPQVPVHLIILRCREGDWLPGHHPVERRTTEQLRQL